ncbi:MAG TPA: hypothetical protein VJ652_16475 [Noviherbaspirillum sp.]|nr:hypothetical protein [Noviherbaspirillum sp.]
MNEQKMREAFADAFAKEVQSDQLTVLAMWSDEDGAFLNAEMQVGWNMWQAATSAARRDAMAVAEAVRDAVKKIAAEWGCPEMVEDVDLAAIVEAVRPACQHRIADARNPVVTSGYLCVDCGALFSAADHGEPKQPASAKQQGEPVADVIALLRELEWSDSYFNGGGYAVTCCPVCHSDESAGHKADCRMAVALSAPPAPTCCVPNHLRYTCKGKGGEYELLGTAIGAGTSRDKSFIVYRDNAKKLMFFRTHDDFATRMEQIAAEPKGQQ